jgi:hypothetical protein
VIAESEVAAIRFTKNAIDNSIGIATEIMKSTAANQKRKNEDDRGLFVKL